MKEENSFNYLKIEYSILRFALVHTFIVYMISYSIHLSIIIIVIKTLYTMGLFRYMPSWKLSSSWGNSLKGEQ